MPRLSALLFLILAVAPSAHARSARQAREQDQRPGAIYGRDDRQELYEVKDAKVRALADSAVALVRSGSAKEACKLTLLQSASFGESFGLCKTEKFYKQPAAAFCSGSLIGPDLVLTAGHCVRTQEQCEDTLFVFGYALAKKGAIPSIVRTNDVYACAELVSQRYKEDTPTRSLDWAIVRLQRKVDGHKPLALDLDADPAVGTKMLVIGHPSGLPEKIASNASVLRNDKPWAFQANLDSFGGNSGSPVFATSTRRIVGVLVRGYTDFEERSDGKGGKCNVASVYPNRGIGSDGKKEGDSQVVMKLKAFASHIPGSQVAPDPCEERCVDDPDADDCRACRHPKSAQPAETGEPTSDGE